MSLSYFPFSPINLFSAWSLCLIKSVFSYRKSKQVVQDPLLTADVIWGRTGLWLPPRVYSSSLSFQISQISSLSLEFFSYKRSFLLLKVLTSSSRPYFWVSISSISSYANCTSLSTISKSRSISISMILRSSESLHLRAENFSLKLGAHSEKLRTEKRSLSRSG